MPFELSNTRFAYESLLVPAVVMTDGKDSPLQQIQGALKQVGSAGQGARTRLWCGARAINCDN